jgi:hypothetical protein
MSAENEKISQIEIHFGDIFIRPFKNELLKHVITNLGHGSYFFAAVIQIINGEENLFHSGTYGFGDIYPKMTGERWSLERIIQAYDRYYKNRFNILLPDESRQTLIKQDRRGSRILPK